MAADCERASAAFVAVVEVLRDDAQMLDARAGHLQHFDPQTIDLDHVAGLWHPVQGLHDQTANGVGTSGLDVATEHALQRVDRQPAGTLVCLRTDRLPNLCLVMELVLDAAEVRLENVRSEEHTSELQSLMR